MTRQEQRPGTYFLNAPLGRHVLHPHDEASRAELGEDHRMSQTGRADDVTHFATDVEIPSDRMGLSMVTFLPEGQAHHEVLALSMHPVSGFDLDNGTSASALVADGGSVEDDVINGSGLVHCSPDQVIPLSLDTAAALVFMHPELTSLSPVEAGRISCHLYHSNPVLDLARAIKGQGQASLDGGWATLVPMMGADGGPRLTSAGTPLNDIKLSDATLQALRPAVQDVLAKVKRDPTLPNKQYLALPGTSEMLVPLIPEPAADAGVGAPSSGYTLVPTLDKGTHSHGVTWQDLSVSEGPPRVVSLTLRNRHLRWFSIHVEYLDVEGKPLGFAHQPAFCQWVAQYPAVFPCAPFLDGETQRFVGLLAAPPTVMGVPVQDLSVYDTKLVLPMPDEAVTMRLMLGSAGTGSWADTRVLLPGLTLTVALQMALPLYTIVSAYGLEETTSLWKTYLAKPLLVDLVLAGITAFPFLRAVHDMPANGRPAEWSEAQRRTLGGLGISALSQLATGMVGFLLDSALAGWIAKHKATAEAEEKVPIVGLALQIATVTVSAIDLGITTTQLLSNPAVFDNRITLGLDVRTSIHPDLDSFQLPSTATTYEVQVTPVGKGARTYTTGTLTLPPVTGSDPLIATVSGIPSGGTLRLNVQMRDGLGRLVGQCWAARYKLDSDALARIRAEHATEADLEVVMGKLANMSWAASTYADTPALVAALEASLGVAASDRYRRSVAAASALIDLAAVLPSGAKQLAIECTLTELKVPLSAKTVYTHKQKLALSDGVRVWEAGPAPSATWRDTSCAGSMGALCELAKPTLIQRTGQLGYTWRSASTGLGECSTGVTKTQLWGGQAVSMTQHPQASFEPLQVNYASCGLAPPVLLAFDLMGPHDGRGLNVAVVPTVDAEGNPVWDARRVVVDGKGALEVGAPSFNGRLGLAPSAVAVHPGGYLVAVNQLQDKLEILQLSELPLDALEAPRGTIYAGEGALPGLLDQPVAVAVGPKGSIYVLEAGNRRVQAFDVFGLPVSAFAKDSSPFFPLDPSSAGNTLLDLAVESTGFVYVLSAAGAGTEVSDYWLDLYDAEGALLARTQGVTAAKLLVDLWRNVYSVNFERLARTDGVIEPSVSLWIPQTPL
ncbi:MAG: NHL repeat-containing protein [Myxococcaceae bacterium]